MINSCWDLLAYNRPYEALVGGLEGLPEEARNSLWLLFTRASMRTLLVDGQREAPDDAEAMAALTRSFRA